MAIDKKTNKKKTKKKVLKKAIKSTIAFSQREKKSSVHALPKKQKDQKKKKSNQPTRKKKSRLVDLLSKENKKIGKKIKDKAYQQHQQDVCMHSLGNSYNQTRLVMMVRDPYWVYIYWQISKDKLRDISYYTAKKIGHVRTILRIYDVSDGTGGRTNYFDIDVPLDVGCWYVYVGSPRKKFVADLGLLDQQNNFYLIAWSNEVAMPSESPSDLIDSRWAIHDTVFNDLYSSAKDRTDSSLELFIDRKHTR